MSSFRTNISGFTLIELAVILMISGMLLAGAMSLMKPYVDTARRNGTEQKLENISQALALFVQNNYRLPCPANPQTPATEPFGTPRNSTAAGNDYDVECGTATFSINDYVGIVPFRALGLTADNVKDSYGHWITYAVSPVLATEQQRTATPNRAHRNVRLSNIWIDSGANKNPFKARFCGPPHLAGNNYLIEANDINVLDANDKQLFSRTRSTNAGDYNTVNTAGTLDATSGNQLIAFVLISHGKNGDGAYLAPDAGLMPTTVSAASQEDDNYDTGNLNFRSRNFSLANDANYFDDIVLWRTNDQVISAFGNDSCNRP